MLHLILTIVLVAIAAATAWGLRGVIALNRTSFKTGAADSAFLLVLLVGEHMVNSKVLGIGWGSAIFVAQLVFLLAPWTLLMPERDSIQPQLPDPTGDDDDIDSPPPAATARPLMGSPIGSTSTLNPDEEDEFAKIASQFRQEA